MRPVVRGVAPQGYSHWKHARNDLANRIGWSCSYCEMAVSNMIEVEHIIPRNKGGNSLDWDNFLLSCRYCNGVKGDRNTGTAGYLWPDRDNTDLAFQYSILRIQPAAGPAQQEAANTIELMGLNKRPGGAERPSQSDTRWIFRLQAWIIAKRSLNNWHTTPSPMMAEQIALTALGMGFYSVWVTVFHGEQDVLDQLSATFPNTYSLIDGAGNRIVRVGGVI